MSSRAGVGTTIGTGGFRISDNDIGRSGRIDHTNISAEAGVRVKGKGKLKKKIGKKPEIEVEIEISTDFVTP